MAKNKKPAKAYVPKPVRPPVTKGLFDELGQDLHFHLMSFMHGGGSMDSWKKIAKVLMTMSFATDDYPRVAKEDKIAIDSAVLVMRTVSDLNLRTGKWHVSSLDIIALQRGASAVDRVLPYIDYRRLSQGYTAFTNLARLIK